MLWDHGRDPYFMDPTSINTPVTRDHQIANKKISKKALNIFLDGVWTANISQI